MLRFPSRKLDHSNKTTALLKAKPEFGSIYDPLSIPKIKVDIVAIAAKAHFVRNAAILLMRALWTPNI